MAIPSVVAAPTPSSGGDIVCNERKMQDIAATQSRFNLLEDDSKERVLRLLTAFRNLTPLEQDAFAQFLGVCLPRTEQHQRQLSKRQLGGPALGVRRRDCSYVALAPPVAGSFLREKEVDAPLQSRCAADVNLMALLEPFLPEERFLTLSTVEKGKEEGTTTPALISSEPSDEHKESLKGVTDEQPQVMRGMTLNEDVDTLEDEESKEPLVLIRSRGYQALRLARGEEHDIVHEAYTTPSVLNTTGMPIDEGGVWEWFDAMDVTRSRTVGAKAFLLYIKELERDFGVPRKVEEQFEEEVEALAVDGVLTFETFAYLVSRFPRH